MKFHSFEEGLIMTSNFYSLIHERLIRNPGQIFLKFPGAGKTSLHSGREILTGVAQVWHSLEKSSIKKGSKVLVAVPFSFRFVCVFLGIMAYGAIPVLPPAGASKNNLISLILQQEIKSVFFADREILLSFLLKVFSIKAVTTNFDFKKTTSRKPIQVPGTQTAFISFSSGSTGKPTPVVRGHQILLEQHLALKASFPSLPDQKDFPLFPNILLHNLCLGNTTIIPDIPEFDVRKLQPGKIVKQIQVEQVESLTGNVFYFKKILAYLQTSHEIFTHVKELGIGGSPVPEYLPHLLRKYFVNANIYIIYGSTQAEPISIRKMGKELANPKLGYFVGTLHPNIELEIRGSKIMNIEGKNVSSGSISIRGKHVVPDRNSEWLVTGDFGYLDEKEKLFLTARSGNENLIQGFSHYQLEHTLINIPGVRQAAAIAQGIAFKIYFEGDAALSEIRISLKKNFPESIVKSVEKIEKMPMDSRHHSKILYKKLCTPNLKT